MSPKKNLTVFCSSKNNLDQKYYNMSADLINLLDTDKINLVYGGGSIGIMGTVRKTWESKSGTIISVNMNKFVESDITDDYLFDNIDDRQKKLIDLADSYLVLPGGYGTLFEMMEAMTKNDIGESSKKIFIYNINGIFDKLIGYIDDLISQGFITRNFEKIKVITSSDPNYLASQINMFDL